MSGGEGKAGVVGALRRALLRMLGKAKTLTSGRRYKPEKVYMRGPRNDRPAGPNG